MGRVIRTEEVAGEDLLGAWEPAPVSPGRAFLRTLSACSRLLSWAGLSTTAETLLAEVFTTTWPLPEGTVTTVEVLLVGAVTTVETLLAGLLLLLAGAAAGERLWKNFSRACCVLEDEEVQARVGAVLEESVLELS